MITTSCFIMILSKSFYNTRFVKKFFDVSWKMISGVIKILLCRFNLLSKSSLLLSQLCDLVTLLQSVFRRKQRKT